MFRYLGIRNSRLWTCREQKMVFTRVKIHCTKSATRLYKIVKHGVSLSTCIRWNLESGATWVETQLIKHASMRISPKAHLQVEHWDLAYGIAHIEFHQRGLHPKTNKNRHDLSIRKSTHWAALRRFNTERVIKDELPKKGSKHPGHAMSPARRWWAPQRQCQPQNPIPLWVQERVTRLPPVPESIKGAQQRK